MPANIQTRSLYQNSFSPLKIWKIEEHSDTIDKEKTLRILTHALAIIRWTPDGWKNAYDIITRASGQGIFFADLSTREIRNKSFLFTFYWMESENWENKDFEVKII